MMPDPAKKSMILYRALDEKNFNGKMTIDVYAYEGGSAKYEAEEVGFLDYTISDMHEGGEGFFVMEGFYMIFQKDWQDEVDALFYNDKIRPATEADWKRFETSPDKGMYYLDGEEPNKV